MIKLYKLIFPNGKVYIGQTKKHKIEYRTNNGWGYILANSGKAVKSPLAKAIVEFGWRNVSVELLEEVESQENADILEKNYIKKYHSDQYEYGYNVACGGKSEFIYNQAYRDNARKLFYKRLDKGELHIIKKGEHISPNTEFKKGVKPLFSRKVLCIENGKIYNSVRETSNDLCISEACISRVCRGERAKTHNLHFKYID